MKIKVGARKSPIALNECKFVASLLKKAGAEVGLRPIETVADSLEVTLKEEGGSEVFAKEVDEALVRGDIDVAVHDMKHVGPVMPQGVSIAAVPLREDAREAFISTRARNFAALPKGSRIGLASQVAHVQVAKQRPDLLIVPMTSELEGLLRSLKDGELDAMLTAACDLRRMNFGKLIAEELPVDKIVPPIGQGALSIQVRGAEKDLMRFVMKACHHKASGMRMRAERSFLKAVSGLEGAIFAAHAEIKPSGLSMIGFVSTADGSDFVIDKMSGDIARAPELGADLAKKLLDKFSA